MRADYFPRVIAPDPDQLVKAKEAARLLGVSEKTIRRYASAGILPPHHLPPANPSSNRPRPMVRFRLGDVARLSASGRRQG
jgi:hypothetical protein